MVRRNYDNDYEEDHDDEDFEEVYQDNEKDERAAAFGSIGISIIAHAVVLLLLALVVFAQYLEVEKGADSNGYTDDRR